MKKLGRNKNQIIVLIDLKEAFDNISRETVLQALVTGCNSSEDKYIGLFLEQILDSNEIQYGNNTILSNKRVP